MGNAGSLDHVLTKGMVVLNRYELKLMIGEGGMGVVWQGIDRVLGAPVAIKFLKALDEGSRRRFEEESRIAARVSSPHVVKVFDAGNHESVPFLVMEYLEGQTLRECLLVRGRLEPEAVVSIVEQVADGLSQAHAQGIVHRDIKPANVFLLDREAGPFVKILDFGVAKTELSDWTHTGGWLGSVHYVSPEQAADASCATASADSWALAVIAYEALTGRKPFDSPCATGVVAAVLKAEPMAPSMVEPSLPKELDHWMLDALHRDRSRRPASVRHLATSLKTVLMFEVVGPKKRAVEVTESTLALVLGPRNSGTWRTVLVGCVSALIGAAGHRSTSSFFEVVTDSANEVPLSRVSTELESPLVLPCEASPKPQQAATHALNIGVSFESRSPSTAPTGSTSGPSTTPVVRASTFATEKVGRHTADNLSPPSLTTSPSEEALWRMRR